jgi:hypothetical protein
LSKGFFFLHILISYVINIHIKYQDKSIFLS